MPWLINAAQLDKFRKSQKALIILDASWHMSTTERDGKKEFIEKHIIGASYFDVTTFSDPSADAPHSNMLLLDPESIAEKLGAMGIRNDYKIILYDNSKLHTSCRAAWMLQVFGHNPQLLYILDGGLHAWEKYGGKTESGEPSPAKKQYTVALQNKLIRTLPQMKESQKGPTDQIVDVRHAVRFAGGPDSKPGLRLGHIPGSISFPYTSLFEKNDYWRPLEKVRHQLNSTSIDLSQPIISTCGSGMTAPILNFALDLLGHQEHAVYNGSWSEWGAQKIYPGEKSIEERPVRTCLD